GNQYNFKHGFGRVKQGKVYRTWVRIRELCNNPNARNYHLYGGKGIRCAWDTFEEFHEDIGKEWPGPGHRLKRANTDDDFHVGNVSWEPIGGTGVRGVTWARKRGSCAITGHCVMARWLLQSRHAAVVDGQYQMLEVGT